MNKITEKTLEKFKEFVVNKVDIDSGEEIYLVLEVSRIITQSHQDLLKEIKEEVEKMELESEMCENPCECCLKAEAYNRAIQDILKILDK